jgi:hypothetical protein
MNVIMPTAMSSIHSDAELITSAEQTANNGMKILRLLKGYDEVVNNCNAILSVCLSMGGDCPEGGIMKDLTEVSSWIVIGACEPILFIPHFIHCNQFNFPVLGEVLCQPGI